MRKRIAEAWKKGTRYYQKDIWQQTQLKDTTPRGRVASILRVFSITYTVFFETNAPSRAAALSFSTMLGIGPCIALGVLIAGVVLGQQDPHIAVDKLNRLFQYLAPALKAVEQLPGATAASEVVTAAGESAAPGAGAVSIAAQSATLLPLLNQFVAGARSGTAGVMGALSLVMIVLLLFKTIEDAFNDIWGVRTGRSLVTRVVFYWSILTLGAVLFLAAIVGVGAAALSSVIGRIPFGDTFGEEIRTLIHYLLPAFSTTLLAALLTLCYRAIPNTRVLWSSAAIGGAVVTVLLLLNQYLTIFYINRIKVTKSLYGSVTLPLVLMLGLYVFWLFILIGGIISYAVQNVHFRNSQAAWSRLTEAQRERLSLIVLLTICRRFQACLPPVSSLQLSSMTKVPTHILNECLSRLVDMKLVAPVTPPDATGAGGDSLYQPARPLNRITLFDFKTLDDNLGEDPMGDSLDRLDPILHRYSTALNQLAKDEFFQKTLEELLSENPFDESRPPFRTLAAR